MPKLRPTIGPRPGAPSRRWLIALAGAFASLCLVLASAAPTASLMPAGAAAPGSGTVVPLAAPAGDTSCGGAGPLGIGGLWTCTFDDEFDGTTLDTTKWTPQVTATSGYVSGYTACFVDSPDNISVSGGDLHLTALKTPSPFTCALPYGGFTTQETSGMVTTYGLFSQAYGAFEVRAQLPLAVIKGLQETFWLYPENQTEYGKWPNSGEIDFAEFYSQYPTLDVPYIHYSAAAKDPNVTAYNCIIVPGTFNTYDVVWSPGTLTVLYNGQVCLTDHPNPAAPLTSPQPFDQPFFIALTQALGVGTNNYNPTLTPLPATTTIDYVRAWEPNT